MHQFGLEQREIHVGGAFGCAPFARETIAQRGVQFHRTQWIVSVHAQFQRRSDYVGAAPRGHDFVMGGHERWTHDASPFKAAAAAVALFQVADEGTVFKCERQHRLEWQLQRSSEVFAQMIVDSGGDIAPRRPVGPERRVHLENFSRVENVFWIEQSLDLAHDLEQLVAKLLSHVFRARDADTVLGRKRAFELPYQSGGLICD